MLTEAAAIARWIALLDRAEQLHRTADGRDPQARRQVDAAIHSLFAFEHILTATQRRLARERLWQRDKAEPLPAADRRQEWEHCRCRTCHVDRILARHPSILVPSASAPASKPTPPPEQGALLPC